MSYWTFNSKNGLKGVEGTDVDGNDCNNGRIYIPDPVNPIVLTDVQILNALETSHRARRDFEVIYPTLLPEEQERLSNLIKNNPRLSTLNVDENIVNDRIQAKEIRSIPVRTVGRRGGIGYRGRM